MVNFSDLMSSRCQTNWYWYVWLCLTYKFGNWFHCHWYYFHRFAEYLHSKSFLGASNLRVLQVNDSWKRLLWYLDGVLISSLRNPRSLLIPTFQSWQMCFSSSKMIIWLLSSSLPNHAISFLQEFEWNFSCYCQTNLEAELNSY